MDIKEIQNLIRFVAKSGASEVKLETEDIKITIKTTSESAGQAEATIVQQIPVHAAMAPVAAASAAPAAPAPATPAKEEEDLSKYITVKSPIIGTFYRKPSPDKPNFVEVGSSIGEGDVLCVALPVGGSARLDARGEEVTVTTARLPHDCDPTVGIAQKTK